MSRHACARLTPSQEAALATIACGAVRNGSITLLCGPRGVGKSTVLAHLVASPRLAPRSIRCLDAASWAASLTADRGDLPDIVVVDDAHLGDGDLLARLAAACRNRPAGAALVLAGEGRLFTLVSRDPRLEQAVHLRASLRPCALDEARPLLAAALGAVAAGPAFDAALHTIHEIAGGIPAAMLRLAHLAAVVAASRPDGSLTPADVETIHHRLSPLAA